MSDMTPDNKPWPWPGESRPMTPANSFASVFPQRQPQRLSEADIEFLATADAGSSYVKGLIAGKAARADDELDPARPLVQALLAVPTRDQPPPPTNPARVKRLADGAPKRPLGVADLAWLEELGRVPPGEVADRDVTALAEMLERVPEGSDWSLVARRFAPVKALHDLAEAKAQLQAVLLGAPAKRSPAVEQAARAALAAKIAEAHPDFTPAEASNRARDRLVELWSQADTAVAEAAAAARNRVEHIPGLERPPSSASYEDGLQAGTAAREAVPAPGAMLDDLSGRAQAGASGR